MFSQLPTMTFILAVTVSAPVVQAHSLNLFRITHWHHQRQSYRETTTESEEEFQSSQSRLSVIANADYFNDIDSDSEDYGNSEAFEREDRDYGAFATTRRPTAGPVDLINHLDAKAAYRELVKGQAKATAGSLSFSSFSFPESMSYPEYTPSAAPIFDEFPDLTGDLSLSYRTEPLVVISAAPSPSPRVEGVPGPSTPSSLSGPTNPSFPRGPTNPSPAAPTINTRAGTLPSGSTTGGSATASSPASSFLESSPTSSAAGSSSGAGSPSSKGDEGTLVADNKDKELSPIGLSPDQKARATMIAVLVGAAVAFVAAVGARKWHQGARGGNSASSPSSSGSEASSQVSSQEGQPLNLGISSSEDGHEMA